MKSTIKVDFKGLESSTGIEPVIKVSLRNENQYEEEDVRDKLLKTFFQSLGGNSSWLKVKYNKNSTLSTEIEITPVKNDELGSEIKVMESRLPAQPTIHKQEFIDFLMMKLRHMAVKYKDLDDMKKDLLSGHITISISDVIDYHKEYEGCVYY